MYTGFVFAGVRNRRELLTMSVMSATVSMKMAAIAQVLRAQRVWSIQVEKDTSFLGKTFHIHNSNKDSNNTLFISN